MRTTAKQKLPNFTEITDTLGWIYMKKNLTDSAIDNFKRLVVQAPQNPGLPLPLCDGAESEGRPGKCEEGVPGGAGEQAEQGAGKRDQAADVEDQLIG